MHSVLCCSLVVEWVMEIWLTAPFTHSPVSSFLLFFWYSVFGPPTLIFTFFPLHMRVHNHCHLLSFCLSLPLPLLRSSYFFSLFHSALPLWDQNTAFCSLLFGNKLSDIIAQTILILTKVMLRKRIWLLVC